MLSNRKKQKTNNRKNPIQTPPPQTNKQTNKKLPKKPNHNTKYPLSVKKPNPSKPAYTHKVLLKI